MDVLSFRDYCLSLPLAEETTPFDEVTLVYKIGGKMFAYADMVDFGRFSVKCDPDEAILLRDRHSEITPGFHMNKRHWNTIATTGDLPDAFLRAQIRNSYRLVLCGVTPRTLRDEITAYLQKVGLPSVDPSTASEIAEEAP